MVYTILHYTILLYIHVYILMVTFAAHTHKVDLDDDMTPIERNHAEHTINTSVI